MKHEELIREVLRSIRRKIDEHLEDIVISPSDVARLILRLEEQIDALKRLSDD